MKHIPRDDWDDMPSFGASLPNGAYTTGFSALIKDGVPQEPVSTLGPIGFVTHKLSAATLKRLNNKNGRPTPRRRKP